ncbi:hypothetical protein [Bacillus sp. V3-13]|uniref:hypothetical protein n=1 Tax=Bacillus sp. V3-13 TaxID=2053728 RepID=UPI0015E118AB|nr:hypothetical protein [Bacillus sp. V3-13]
MTQESNRPAGTLNRKNDDMDGGPIGERLNSDDSFSDTGLNNARLTRKAVNKADSDH